MAVDIGPRIGIDGEKKFRDELNQINQALKTLGSEAKAVTAQMENETDAEKKSAAQKEVLNRQILTQRDKLKKLEEGLKASADKYGEADIKTMKWQQAVHDATAQLAKMENELSDTDEKVEDTAESFEDAQQATIGWADVMKGSLLADAVKSGLTFIKDAVSGIAEKTLEASKAGAAYADNFLTLATTSGVAVDTLQEFAYMDGIADVSVDTLTGAITKLKKTMSTAADQNEAYGEKMAKAAEETDATKRAAKEASIELGSTAAAYQELGVSIMDIDGNFRRAEDVFMDMLTALGDVKDETKRDALAMELMGKSATELNPLITAGADAVAEMREEARKTGYVLSGSALSALGKQQDAMDRLDKKTEALSNRFAVKLAPSMERAYSKINETLDNPRVRRGLDVMAEGISGIIDGAVDLASRVLPDLFNVFSLGDERLKYLTDDQLALVQAVDDSKAAHQEMVEGFKTQAKDIVAETERIQGLWAELQTLVDENGNVKEADEERVNYINSQLKDALGTQMELENGILQGYKDQQKEIDNLIAKREAEALIAAGAEGFAKAEKERNEQLARAAELEPQVAEARRKLAEAEEAYQAAFKATREAEDPDEAEKLLKAENALLKARNEAAGSLKELEDRYKEAHDSAVSMYADVDKWQRAQTAAANGNYKEVVRILTSEFSVTLDYYKEKKRLNDQEKQDLKDRIKDAELTIAEYKRNLEKGLAGFSEAGLKEMESYVAEAKQILDGKALADYWLDGLKAGLGNQAKLREVGQAAKMGADKIVKTARETLSVQSPSKVAKWIGEMWDKGLVEGLESGEGAVGTASSSVASTLIGGASGLAPSVGTYSGGTALLSGGGTTSNAYTTNMGGITVRVDGAGAVNEDVLAQRVAVQLTRQLQRAQRAR